MANDPAPVWKVQFNSIITDTYSLYEQIIAECGMPLTGDIDLETNTFQYRDHRAYIFLTSPSNIMFATGVSTDMAINDADSYFAVIDPANGAVEYQRLGNFMIDGNGTLTTADHRWVRGAAEAAPAGSSVSNLDTATPITVFTAGGLVALSPDGKVLQPDYFSGIPTVRGWITRARFAHPEKLTRITATRWAESVESGPPTFGTTDTNSAFRPMTSGALEIPHATLSPEFLSSLPPSCVWPRAS